MLILFLTWFNECVQVFLKLKHESNVEHLFVVPGSARQFKLVLVEYLPPGISFVSVLDDHTLLLVPMWRIV